MKLVKLISVIVILLSFRPNIANSECGELDDCGGPIIPGMTMCNDTAGSFSVALGFKRDGNWHSRGWTTIDRDECQMLVSPLEHKDLYYLIQSKDTFIPRSSHSKNKYFRIIPYPNNFWKDGSSKAECEGDEVINCIQFEHIEAPSLNGFSISILNKYGDTRYR